MREDSGIAGEITCPRNATGSTMRNMKVLGKDIYSTVH